MSNNDPKAATPPSPPPRPATPPPPAAPGPRIAGMRLDPAAAMLGVGAAVLVLALWWLWATPRADQAAAGDERRLAQIEQRLASLEPVREQAAAANARLQGLGALEQRASQVAELEGRLRAIENRPAPAAADLGPIETRITALTERLAAAERAAAQAAERAAAVEARPRIDTDALATKQALEALAGRVEAAGSEAARAAGQRVAALEQQLGQRSGALEQQLTQRSGALEQQVTQRLAQLEQQIGQRMAAVEQAQGRLRELDQRTQRLAALEAVQGALAAGQPLGAALQRLQNAPEALTRFAGQAPPTEASLRLSFEEAARAARAAADPAATGPEGDRGSVADAALSRFAALVTVRRGEQVIWGDAAEAEIEKARRALQAGDVELAVSQLQKLPPAAREAMAGWIGQARALVAARAALRQMATPG